MVRQRQVLKPSKPITGRNERQSKINIHENNEMNYPLVSKCKKILFFVVVVVAFYIAIKGYVETRVITPFDTNKVVSNAGLMVPDRYWGSYRPGTYFGLKTREPYSPVVGLMWFFPNRRYRTGIRIRHWCDQGDELERYSWTHHNGRSFGIHEIDDGPVRLKTSFVKRPGGINGGDWTTRISVLPLSGGSHESISLLFYTALESQTIGHLGRYPEDTISGINGETDKLGRFSIRLLNTSGNIEYESYLITQGKGIHLLKEVVMSELSLRITKGVEQIRFPGNIAQGSTGNFTVNQVVANVPFEMEVIFESNSNINRTNTLTGNIYTELLGQNIENFNRKFEDIFALKKKSFDNEDVQFAQSILSNLIGGIGYFYGSSRVISEHLKYPVSYWKSPLYTAVPSRSFFPRGFLWDEGFHGLLISIWDLEIELDIMSHWFDLMNVEGWIPREQILGSEALAKVPEEFVTQINSNANPPTFFITLDYIIKHQKESLVNENNVKVLDKLYNRLAKWFDWYNTTQVGELPGSYRWRGRDDKTILELNPKTLTSGLDDYPRASHPTKDERHVDLLCWVALGAKVLAEITLLLGRQGSDKYLNTYKYLTNNKHLDHLHWSYKSNSYSDFGLHTDKIILQKPIQQSPHTPTKTQPVIRVLLSEPQPQFVDSNFGYISLFPFFLQILDPKSDKLLTILNDIENPNCLWTDYGLRSLSKKSPLYMKRNTEHDPPYWRGPIWINMNYLALKALHYYSRESSLHSEKAMLIYKRLRHNLIKNVIKEYKRTGYIWEQYDDVSGRGQRSHPFTGWSSLIVLIMGEIY